MHDSDREAVLGAMRILARLVLMFYVLALFFGLGYWWYVWQMHNGMPPQSEVLGRWAIANTWAFDFSLNLMTAQLTYPVFWWFTRRMTWTGFWRVVRSTQAVLVLTVILLFLILLWATPDVSGFRS
jgi:hypothetical protein